MEYVEYGAGVKTAVGVPGKVRSSIMGVYWL